MREYASSSSVRSGSTKRSEAASATRSRPLQRPVETLPARRSRSSMRSRSSRTASRRNGASTSSATPCWRWRIVSTSRRGASSHSRRSREPIGVSVASSVSRTVPSRRPSRCVATSSRQLRVARSRTRKSAVETSSIRTTWAQDCCCVSSRYSSKEPAAGTTLEPCSMPKPSRFSTRKCLHSVRSDVSRSKRQASRSLSAIVSPLARSVVRSGAIACSVARVSGWTNSSAGRSRASSSATPARGTSQAWRRPVERSTQASPARSSESQRLAR